ncbi:MAG: aspartate/glutamate racemase family protein [Pseudomonadota bacterium]
MSLAPLKTATQPPRPVRYDAGRHPRAKLGFVLLATEQTIEDDLRRLAPPDVGVHFTRAPIPDSITCDSLGAMAQDLAEAAALILPDGSLDVVCYACTSGSIVITEQVVLKELARGQPKAQATSLITGVIRALKALQARRIVVATPYLEEINRLEARYLADAGFEVLAIEGLQIEQDSDMVRVAPDFIAEFAASLDRPDAEAIFISCGALRSIDILAPLEQRLGKPVVASNQAMAWDCLRLAGVTDVISGAGRLLSDH